MEEGLKSHRVTGLNEELTPKTSLGETPLPSQLTQCSIKKAIHGHICILY